LKVKVVSVSEKWLLIEYELKGIQRKYLPRILLNTSKKGEYEISERDLDFSVEYSDVDVFSGNFGTQISPILIHDIEQACRRKGLWLREDYRKNPEKIKKIIIENGWKELVDVTTIINLSGG